MQPFRLGQYQVIKLIDRGGMASIYLAEDTETGKEVAVKQILPHIAADEEFIHRFVHEIKVMMKLNHPNILPILNAELGPEQYYIVMPLIEKGTLKDLLTKTRKIPADFSVFIITEVLKSLDYAHHQKVIHRDLKPSNIMFAKDGTVYLTDFGVARVQDMTQLTQTGEVLGTPGYMSPEQALGEDLTPASDLFSIGVIFYELLSGYNPFQTDNPVTTMKQVVESHPPALLDIDPSLPTALEPIILRLMRKQVSNRYQSAIHVLEDIMIYWQDRNPVEIKQKYISFINDPRGTIGDLLKREAKQRLQRAGELWLNADMRPRALWEAFQATRMDPDFEEAKLTVERWSRLLGAETVSEEDPRVEGLEKKWREEPDNVQVLLQLGKIYRMRKDYINLMKVYQRLERLNPQDPYTVGQMRTLLERSEQKQVPAQASTSSTDFIGFLKQIPTWLYILVAAIIVIFVLIKNIDLGDDTLPGLETSPGEEKIMVFEALQDMQDSISSQHPDIQKYVALEKSGQYQEAFRGYENMLLADPYHPEATHIHYRAGYCAYMLKIFDAAAEHLGQAFHSTVPPGKWNIGIYYAKSLAEGGQELEAERIWDTIIEKGESRFAARALFDKAHYYLLRNMLRTGRQYLEDVVTEYPDSPEADQALKQLKELKAER